MRGGERAGAGRKKNPALKKKEYKQVKIDEGFANFINNKEPEGKSLCKKLKKILNYKEEKNEI